jgi:hypothetical protein
MKLRDYLPAAEEFQREFFTAQARILKAKFHQNSKGKPDCIIRTMHEQMLEPYAG